MCQPNPGTVGQKKKFLISTISLFFSRESKKEKIRCYHFNHNFIMVYFLKLK